MDETFKTLVTGNMEIAASMLSSGVMCYMPSICDAIGAYLWNVVRSYSCGVLEANGVEYDTNATLSELSSLAANVEGVTGAQWILDNAFTIDSWKTSRAESEVLLSAAKEIKKFLILNGMNEIQDVRLPEKIYVPKWMRGI